MTKSQVIEQVKEQGLSPEYEEATLRFLSEFQENLTEADISRIDEFFAEAEAILNISASNSGKIADSLERASDGLVTATEDYMDRVTGITNQDAEEYETLMGVQH